MDVHPDGWKVEITLAVVRFQVEGFHHWEGATGQRSYLASRHRHLFHVEASIQLFGDDREIEFHDFLDFCKSRFGGGDMDGQSCETMAKSLIKEITRHYPERRVIVSVFEDGEVGARVILDTRRYGPPDQP